MSTMAEGSLHFWSAFTDDPAGGNPAGVWVGDELPDADAMQRIAARVGFSETAFVAPRHGARRTVRYYSPAAEVPFCGHATIAAGVQLGYEYGSGAYRFDTAVGEVVVGVRVEAGLAEASLTSVPTRHVPVASEVLAAALAALDWRRGELDAAIPPAKAYAGAWHLVLAAGSRERLRRLRYDFERLRQIMLGEDLTTVQLIWRERSDLIHARNPFPVGGVVEDPATGAAAAALGGYLRDAGLLSVPAALVILQGEDMGRPSRLRVSIPPSGGITVAGAAVRIAAP